MLPRLLRIAVDYTPSTTANVIHKPACRWVFSTRVWSITTAVLITGCSIGLTNTPDIIGNTNFHFVQVGEGLCW